MDEVFRNGRRKWRHGFSCLSTIIIKSGESIILVVAGIRLSKLIMGIKLKWILFLISGLSLLSFTYKESKTHPVGLVSSNWKGVHKKYYSTGELRYTCVDHHYGTTGRATGMIRLFRFERIYFDKCGNKKFIVKGKGESGCWRNKITISKQARLNENVPCDKEAFVYLTDEELMAELKGE